MQTIRAISCSQPERYVTIFTKPTTTRLQLIDKKDELLLALNAHANPADKVAFLCALLCQSWPVGENLPSRVLPSINTDLVPEIFSQLEHLIRSNSQFPLFVRELGRAKVGRYDFPYTKEILQRLEDNPKVTLAYIKYLIYEVKKDLSLKNTSQPKGQDLSELIGKNAKLFQSHRDNFLSAKDFCSVLDIELAKTDLHSSKMKHSTSSNENIQDRYYHIEPAIINMLLKLLSKHKRPFIDKIEVGVFLQHFDKNCSIPSTKINWIAAKTTLMYLVGKFSSVGFFTTRDFPNKALASNFTINGLPINENIRKSYPKTRVLRQKEIDDIITQIKEKIALIAH